MDRLSSLFDIGKRTVVAAAALWFLFLLLGLGLRVLYRLVVVLRLVIIVARVLLILMRSRGSLILFLFSVMNGQWLCTKE